MSVALVKDRGAVRVLTMNRPERRNAPNTELTMQLHEANKRMRAFRKP